MAAMCAKCTISGAQENGDGDLSVRQGLQGPSWPSDVTEYCTSERGKVWEWSTGRKGGCLGMQRQ